MADVTVLIPVLRGYKPEWLQECVTSFPAGTPYLVAENDGELADAMNQALAQVETEWVLPFGYDDVADDHLIDNLLAVSADADVVYPSMWLTDELLRPQGLFNADVFCGNRLQIWNYVPGGFIARTKLVRQVGGWRDLDALEDWDLHVRLYRAGARFKACPNARFLYRQVEGSRNKHLMDRFDDVLGMRKHYQDLIVGTRPELKASFYYQATPATAYWRCVLPARRLPGQATWELEAVKKHDGQIVFPRHEGAAVFQYPANNERAAAMLGMQQQGIRYLVEVDDNYLDTSDIVTRQRAGWALTIQKQKDDGQGRWNPHSVEAHRWITSHADGVIVSTPTLAEVYGDVNNNVTVCKNSIDPDDWPEYRKPDDGMFRIGWFASQSHDRDAPLIRKALSWASRQPNVEVITIGLDPPDWTFTRKHITWTEDFTGYRRMLHMLDVGLAPVTLNSWSKHRSDLKCLEYGMAGAVTVMSNVPCYDTWQGPGLRATTAREFEDHIRWCVRNQDEARELGRQARTHVLGTRTIDDEIINWEKAVAG